jgi:hypothetical protein
MLKDTPRQFIGDFAAPHFVHRLKAQAVRDGLRIYRLNIFRRNEAAPSEPRGNPGSLH